MDSALLEKNRAALFAAAPAAARLLDEVAARGESSPPLSREEAPGPGPGSRYSAPVDYARGGIVTGAPARPIFERAAASTGAVHWISPAVEDLLRVVREVDIAEPLRAGRWHVFAGPGWTKDWHEYLSRAPFDGWPIPYLRANGPNTGWIEWADPTMTEAVARLMRVYETRLKARIAEVAALYERQEPLREVLRHGRRAPRVLGLAPLRSQWQRYGMEDLIAGFRAAGWEGRALLLEAELASHEALDAVEEMRPDLMVFLSFTHEATRRIFPPGLPAMVWDVDDALAQARVRWEERYRPGDRVFVLLDEWKRRIGPRPNGPRVLPLASNPDRWGGPDPSPEECERYGSRVSFVASYQPGYLDQYAGSGLQPRLAAALRGAHDDLLARLPATRGRLFPDLGEVLERALARHGIRLTPEALGTALSYFRYRIVHQAIRVPYLEALLPHGLALWGSGWDKVSTLARAARGHADNRTELGKVFRASDVNVHFHAWTANHPRLFDTAAAGGFLLVGALDEERPVGRFFEVGLELDVFRDREEMVRKVEYYLARPELRREMAERARERVLSDHTFEARVRTVIVPAYLHARLPIPAVAAAP
ncbi:MAG: glycosyltransferase [Planctomycetes bacterium]|nr:glycosyltransferase [Planctomycetota bacterium]